MALPLLPPAPQHDPNTVHVFYGMDADLILLALASHEPHFYVIREMLPPKNKHKRKHKLRPGESAPSPAELAEAAWADIRRGVDGQWWVHTGTPAHAAAATAAAASNGAAFGQ